MSITPENRKYVIFGIVIIIVTAMITGNFDALVEIGKDVIQWLTI